MKDEIKNILKQIVGPEANFVVEAPKDLTHGDFATNVAIVAKVPAADLVAKIVANKPDWLEKVEIAGPGFINFYLAPQIFTDEIKKILNEKEKYGKNESLAGQKIIIEYTDPNPFKEFHIGHLMSNAIGESLSRLLEFSGAEVKRACYQGDVGLHVAKAVWAKGDYVLGSKKYEEDEMVKKEVIEINKKIYDRSDEKVNKIYDEGRKVSLEAFEVIYKTLGTKFDYYFFESQTGGFGKKLVEENVGRAFVESDGAIIFRGEEKAGLHTRVFINSQGLPTYEAKELGLAKIKYDTYPYDRSIVVTGNEINAYFKVLLAALKMIYPELAERTKHISHGMLRLPSGKMSSRTGDVITAEELIAEAKKSREDITEEIAVAAIKYSILKQSPGKDIIFDLTKSLAVEGDSGPYLQYSCVRARSVVEKAGGVVADFAMPAKLGEVEKMLLRFPDVAERAMRELAPNQVITYLIEVASAFNAFYAQNKIIGSEEEKYRVALTAAVAQVLENGLWLLGIKVPDKM